MKMAQDIKFEDSMRDGDFIELREINSEWDPDYFNGISISMFNEYKGKIVEAEVNLNKETASALAKKLMALVDELY